MTTARGIALQGFLLTPIAMAVQGLLSGDPVLPTDPSPALRAPVVGSGGPGSHVNLSDYLRQFGRGVPVAPMPVQQILQTTRTRRARRQRREEEVLLLCALE